MFVIRNYLILISFELFDFGNTLQTLKTLKTIFSHVTDSHHRRHALRLPP